jgi:hypothetical protein
VQAKCSSGNLKSRILLVELAVGGKIILKSIFEKGFVEKVVSIGVL